MDSTIKVESIFWHCMDLRSSQPFWPVHNGLLHAYPALESNTTCDVIVLGGGITGALVAWHLVDAGFDVIVLDKREIGWGSTSASTALLQYEIDVPLVELAELRGQRDAECAYLACRDAIDKLAALADRLRVTDFARRQSLYLASKKRDVDLLQREFAARRACGIDVLWVDGESLRSDFAIDRPAAILSTDAAQMDAYRFTHALLQAPRGLRVFDRTEAVQIDANDAGVTVRTDAGHTVQAGHLVFATGFESQQYLKQPVAKLISTYALVSEPLALPAWLQDTLVWEHASPYFYLRTTADGRLMMGGEDVPFRDPRRRDRLIDSKTRRLLRKLDKLLPRMNVTPAFAWAGTFGETEDGLAYIGSVPEWQRAFFALGYGGNGITFSMIAAEIIRDALLGRHNDAAHLFSFDRA